MVFALIAQGGILSSIITSEFSDPYKTMPRVRLSLIRPWEYILGATIVQILITPLQIGSLFVMAFAMGFSPGGSIPDAFITYWLASLFSLALTFLGAAFFSNPEAAGSSVGFLGTPLAFASGAFFEIPPITLIKNIFPTPTGGLRDFTLWDILPTTHVVNATRSILISGYSFMDVISDILFFIFGSVLLFVIALIIFRKRRFQGDI